MRKYLLSGVILLLAMFAPALEMPAYFSDHMVLQRNAPLPVWGWAAPGEEITVSLGPVQRTACSGSDGRWEVVFPRQEAGGPYALEVRGKSVLRFEDVMVGELWLCSGQSNMAWRLRECENGAEELKRAENDRLRLFQVSRAWSREPERKGSGQWSCSSADSARDFSGVAYFFGSRLAEKLGITVGVIDVSWGGTMIEPWLVPGSTESFAALNDITVKMRMFSPGSAEHKAEMDRQIVAFRQYVEALAACRAAGKVPPLPPVFNGQLRPELRDDPGVIYQGMVQALTPAAVGGMIWYQGEANRADGMLYADKLKALAAGWRAAFRTPEMPFYIVQLAPMQYARQNWTALATIWHAQSIAAREIEHAALAVINDVGNPKDIHPKNKRPVGERLANLALKRKFGQDIPAEFPEPEHGTVVGREYVITFRNAQNLSTHDGKDPNWFELCGNDGVFHPAKAELRDGKTIAVSAGKVARPVAVRFAWNIAAEPNLRNEFGLPVGAFRAGDIPRLNPIQDDVPESVGYQLVFELEPLTAQCDGRSIAYKSDHSAGFVGKKVDRIGYFLELTKLDGARSWVWADMKTFTEDAAKIGVPLHDIFQQNVSDVRIAASLDLRTLPIGHFPDGCNIEFWPNNYRSRNDRKLPGASDSRCDFSDSVAAQPASGFGSMQLHCFKQKQTIFAYNFWQGGKSCDLGIGNCSSMHPDWTGSKSGLTLKYARLLMLVKTK